MPKINPITILGSMLVLAGLLGPWFTFILYTNNSRQYWNSEISPFALKSTVHYVGDPSKRILSSNELYFYGMNTTTVGIISVLGAIVSFIGGSTNREKLIFVGGGLVLLSNLLFPMCLPGRYVAMEVGWGGAISTIGAFIIIFSYGFYFFKDIFNIFLNFFRDRMTVRKNGLFIVVLGFSYSLFTILYYVPFSGLLIVIYISLFFEIFNWRERVFLLIMVAAPIYMSSFYLFSMSIVFPPYFLLLSIEFFIVAFFINMGVYIILKRLGIINKVSRRVGFF